MIKSNLQYNLEIILAKKNLDLADFCSLAKVNEYELELLLTRKTISLSHPILTNISKALKCPVTTLFAKQPKTDTSKQRKIKVTNQQKYKDLLPSFSNINIDLFSESVAKVDEMIDLEGKHISPLQKAKAYLAFYELADKFVEGE